MKALSPADSIFVRDVGFVFLVGIFSVGLHWKAPEFAAARNANKITAYLVDGKAFARTFESALNKTNNKQNQTNYKPTTRLAKPPANKSKRSNTNKHLTARQRLDKKHFPTSGHLPIIRDVESNRYWINEKLIISNSINLAQSIKDIIEAYIKARQSAFLEFMDCCQKIIDIQEKSPEKAIEFIKGLFRPNIDARIFEIASFAVLKQHYADQRIYWGWSPKDLKKESLILYKTGRTNANDGGIDFVMKPLGRFFQVTETVDAGKYFLDIDKVQRYPITFVVKTNESSEEIIDRIELQAEAKYSIKVIVKKYIDSIEEVINIPTLMKIFEQVLKNGRGKNVIKEIVV